MHELSRHVNSYSIAPTGYLGGEGDLYPYAVLILREAYNDKSLLEHYFEDLKRLYIRDLETLVAGKRLSVEEKEHFVRLMNILLEAQSLISEER